MFTGIIIETGIVESIEKKPGITRLFVKAPTLHEDAVIGESIAINGVCLTLVALSGNRLTFDLSDETLKASNLGKLKKGERVNLEPSLKADGKLGGHFVTGHVDAIGTIRSIRTIGETSEIDIEAPESILTYLVDKGSVAIDGISLTVVKVFSDAFRLVIIPHTEMVTTIANKREGSSVNIETDIIGKYVKKFLPDSTDASLMQKLTDSGFIND